MQTNDPQRAKWPDLQDNGDQPFNDPNGGVEGSVATLQVARDRLAGCFSWALRFAVYSSGGNLSRRSSCWQWVVLAFFPFGPRRRGVARRAGPARRSRHRLEVGPALWPGNGTVS